VEIVDYIFLKSHYKKEIKLTKELLKQISSYNLIAVFSSIQFVNQMDDIVEQLQEKYPDKEFVTSKPSRAENKYQVLGCNVYSENFTFLEDNNEKIIEPECYLYIGDGVFHPQAIVLSQKENEKIIPVISFNPKNDSIKIFSEEDIVKVIRKYRANLLRFLDSENIGVYVTTKHGQEQYKFSKKIKDKFPNKNFYFFVSETLNIQSMEDFSFIDLWINTACPRIALEDSSELNINSKIKLINIDDALRIEELLSKDCVLTRI
jgi:diphthamide biosynthesis enzyme Dph1/Dph2-like protein